MQQIKNRNEKAIAFIIQTYGGLLTAIIKRHVHYNEQDYEECLDDVLLAIWQNIDAFRILLSSGLQRLPSTVLSTTNEKF